LVISKPIQQKKKLLPSSGEGETKRLTQPQQILAWIKPNPVPFITNDLVDTFPMFTRRVIEKAVKDLVVKGKLSSKKCRCGCANVYTNKMLPPAPEWT
jgi:hypothetical protein